jgi:Mg-chelatase subunit ChlD
LPHLFFATANINTSLKLGNARLVIVVDVASAKTARASLLKTLFASVRKMFPHTEKLEASCLIAVTKLPFEMSARKNTFDDVSEIIRKAWDQGDEDLLGKKSQSKPHPYPKIVQIELLGEPKPVLRVLNTLTTIEGASAHFVPNLPAAVELALNLVLNHVRDQVGQCLEKEYFSDVFSLISLLDKFASFKLKQALIVKNEAVQRIVDFELGLKTDILRLSRASESSKERKEGLYVELFRRFESLCQKFDDLCGQKLSPIWSSFRTEIESIDSRTQRGELDKVKRNSETCLSTLSALLQSETNDIPLKKLISLNCKRIFEDSSNRPESLDNFLKNLIHPSVTSSIQPVLKDAAKDLRSVMLEFAGRHRCCETYVFPRDVDARHEYSELCCFACDQLWSIGKNISLALREAELEKIAVKVLGKMDEILEKSNDPDLCRQIGQNITSQKSMLECGLTSSEMEILREFDEVVLKSAQQPPRNLLNFQPGKKPNAPQVAPGVHVVHPASVKSQVVPRHSASLSPPPVSRPSIAVKPINFPQNSRIPACVPSQDAKLQPQPHVPSAPAAFEDFKQRLDVESCKKCLRWVTRLKEKMFQHCKAISEWLKSLEMLKFHQNAEYSTILSELRQAIPALYDETTVRGWIEKQEFSLLSNTFVEVQSLRAAVQPYNINIKVDEFEHQVSGGITRLFETARGDITSYCSSEEFEGKIRILSMKTLLACNKAFQNTALQVQIQSLVDSFCKLVKKMVEDTCKIRLGGHGLCMRILKLMYLNENLLGVNIPGDFVKNECKKMIELQAQEVVLEAGTEIFANSCDELQDTATKTMQTFPQFRSQSVKWFNSKAGTKDFPAVLKEMRVQILGSAPSKLSSQAQDIMQTCYGIADGIFADQMRSAIDLAQISSTNSQQQPLPQQSTSRNIQPVLDAIRAAVGRHTAAIKGSPGFSGNILGKDVQFHHCIHDVSGLLGNLFAAYSILEGASMFESDRATWLQPHPTQIACILMLLGIGTDNHIVKNQLAEVGTGEGKSIILGMLGLFFALLGKKVDILCYNPYLSERDEKAFQKVFKFFKYIPEFSAPNHCPINKLYEHFVDIHVLPNLRECVQQVAADLRYAHCAGFEQADRVLLIDEVDVFFGEHFFGQVHTTGHVFDDADSRGLVSFVFDNRDKHHSRTIDASIDVLKKNPFFRNLQKKYPKLDLKRHLEQMLRDLNLEDFPVLPGLPLGEGQKLVRVLKKENDIGYLNSATSSIDRNTSYRYKTTFAYLFKCRVSKEIDEKIGKRPYGIILTSGYQLYSELPKYCRLLLGISGTVSKLSVGDHDILKEFNFSTTTLVPSTFRKEHVVQAVSEKGFDINFQSKDAFHSQIVARVQDVRSQQSFHRPILIVLKDESEVKIFARKFQSTLRQLTAPLQLTEAVPFDERDRIISLASSEGAITLVARSYGRGSDFVSFSRAVNDKGGVHVILTFLPELVSEMVQIKGRTGRQDNKGSFEELYWKDDLVTDADGNTRYVSAVELDAFWSGHPDNTERHKFLCDKRDEHDRNRTQRMKAKLESNRGRATRTTEMVGFAAQNRTQQAIDIAYEFSFATVTSVTHTVFIIDESGSMKDRWSSLQKSFSAYLRILIAKGSSSDVVSVIQFDTDARLVDHATKISPQQASQLSLNMRGNGTNFGPAIALANDFLEQDSYPSDIVLVFMTDGENTDGDVALGALQNLFKNRSARNPKFNAIGFIQQPASLMQMVAAVQPDGFLYAANDAVQLEQRFVEVAEAMCMGERKVGDASKQKH